MKQNPINVIIVDDSKTCIASLKAILDAEPDINVIAVASDGEEGLKLTRKLQPDLVTMDIFMPKMDGVETTRAIMEQCPTPILIISSPSNQKESKFVFDSLEAGALSIIKKPYGQTNGDFSKIQRHIVNSVRTLAKVHVFRRRHLRKHFTPISNLDSNQLGAKILALGASTGGPEALRCIISSLPGNFPMPIVVAQHITEGFLPGLINWLQKISKLQLKIATHDENLLPGNVYFAPDNSHLKINRGPTPIAKLDDSDPIDLFKPSINALLSSIAENYPGKAIAGLLTGMGRDGCQGLLEMKNTGCITFAQSEKTCTIYGMPGVAVKLDAVNYSVDLEKIPQFLARLLNEGRNNR